MDGTNCILTTGENPTDTPEMLGDLSILGQTVYPSSTAAIAAVEVGAETQPMYMDYVEDAANLGFNFYITVDKGLKSYNTIIRYAPDVQ